MTFVKGCQGVSGGLVYLGRMRDWYVGFRVPVLSGGWDKSRCARWPGEFIAKNQKWLYGSELAIHGGERYQNKRTQHEDKSYSSNRPHSRAYLSVTAF